MPCFEFAALENWGRGGGGKGRVSMHGRKRVVCSSTRKRWLESQYYFCGEGGREGGLNLSENSVSKLKTTIVASQWITLSV